MIYKILFLYLMNLVNPVQKGFPSLLIRHRICENVYLVQALKHKTRPNATQLRRGQRVLDCMTRIYKII